MKKKSCIFTFVRNEKTFLPIWLKYYSRFFDKDDIYIIDHESNDGSIQSCYERYKFNLINVHFDCYDDVLRNKVAKRTQAELLERYDYVLYADADEIIVPNPKKYPDLKDYIYRNKYDCVKCTCYEIIHLIKKESPINLNKPIMQQRKYWYPNSFYNKVLLSRVPIDWTPGFHEQSREIIADPDLWLLHLHKLDYKLCWDKHKTLAGEKWSIECIEKTYGGQYRINTVDEFERFFYSRPPCGVKLGTNNRCLIKPFLSFIKGNISAKVFEHKPTLTYQMFIYQHPVITKIPAILIRNRIV